MSKKKELQKKLEAIKVDLNSSHELKVYIKEQKNKISLVRAGVPIKNLQGSEMDIIHEEKLRKNHVLITDNVVFSDIVNYLVQDGILKLSDVQKLQNVPADSDKMLQLRISYLRGPKAYHSLRSALNESKHNHVRYDYIVKNLDECVVTPEDIGYSSDSKDGAAQIEEFVTSMKKEIDMVEDLMTDITNAEKKWPV